MSPEIAGAIIGPLLSALIAVAGFFARERYDRRKAERQAAEWQTHAQAAYPSGPYPGVQWQPTPGYPQIGYRPEPGRAANTSYPPEPSQQQHAGYQQPTTSPSPNPAGWPAPWSAPDAQPRTYPSPTQPLSAASNPQDRGNLAGPAPSWQPPQGYGQAQPSVPAAFGPVASGNTSIRPPEASPIKKLLLLDVRSTGAKIVRILYYLGVLLAGVWVAAVIDILLSGGIDENSGVMMNAVVMAITTGLGVLPAALLGMLGRGLERRWRNRNWPNQLPGQPAWSGQGRPR